MKPVKTQQRYKCDFCKKRGIKRKMEFHEGICFRNPKRMCIECKNTGKTTIDLEGFLSKVECPYCAKFSAETIKEIEARERGEFKLQEEIINEEIPF